MNTERPLRARPARLKEFSRSLLSDSSVASAKVLAPIVIALVAVRTQNYALDALGVITDLGPFKVALAAQLVGILITYYVYRPSLLSNWSIWRPALALGVSRGVNNVAVLYVFVWIRPQFVAPLTFFCQAAFTLGSSIVKDARARKYSTAVWPILALPGIWALVAGSGDSRTPHPGVLILGHEIPGWIMGVCAVIIAAAAFAFNNTMLEVIAERDRDRAARLSDKEGTVGRIATLAGIPSVAVLALGASFLDGGWGVMANENWLNLLVATLSGVVTGVTGVLTVRAFKKGLKKNALTMVQPFMTLVGVLTGMLVEMQAPSLLLGVPGMVLILIASLGAAKYQSQETNK